MSALNQILEHKIVAILRGVFPGDVLPVAHALYEGGIRVVEVTLNSAQALSQIEQLSRQMHDRMLVGAGTVLDAAGVKDAAGAGARFIISPNVDADVIQCTKDHQLVSIPGAYTATEVCLANKYGGDIIKIFPVPDAAYLKSLLAPLNHMRLMATGGVNISNIRQFKEAGAVAFGIGSSLVHAGTINDAYLSSLTEKARLLVAALEEQHQVRAHHSL